MRYSDRTWPGSQVAGVVSCVCMSQWGARSKGSTTSVLQQKSAPESYMSETQSYACGIVVAGAEITLGLTRRATLLWAPWSCGFRDGLLWCWALGAGRLLAGLQTFTSPINRRTLPALPQLAVGDGMLQLPLFPSRLPPSH